jgi:hypothetical protein
VRCRCCVFCRPFPHPLFWCFTSCVSEVCFFRPFFLLLLLLLFLLRQWWSWWWTRFFLDQLRMNGVGRGLCFDEKGRLACVCVCVCVCRVYVAVVAVAVSVPPGRGCAPPSCMFSFLYALLHCVYHQRALVDGADIRSSAFIHPPFFSRSLSLSLSFLVCCVLYCEMLLAARSNAHAVCERAGQPGNMQQAEGSLQQQR